MSRVPAQILELSAEEREELDRRWQAFEQSPDEGEPWEDVKKALLDE